MRHLVILALCVACTRGPAVAPAPTVVPDPAAVLPALDVPRNVHVDSVLAALTLEEQVGQLLMPWVLADYSAYDAEVDRLATLWLDTLAVGGIIVSIGSPLDGAAKLNALQRASRLPLLVAADLEYGAGMRFVGATAFPYPMALGATRSEVDAYEMGRVTALEARAIGVHMTFSPVADLNNNPANPIINTRAWGDRPDAVGPLLAAYIRGASEHGLFTTAKHFPGHGDVGTDSHIEVPVAPGCWDRLDTLELAAFRATIAAGVTAVMTAHIAMPCLDRTDPLPATLSPAIMTGILRDSLGFDGLVVTDALVMGGAIGSRFDAGEIAVRAFAAGSDMLLMPADLRAARDAMVAAVRSGRISRARLEASVRRILALKAEAGLFARRTVRLDSVPAIVGTAGHQALADDIAQRALTLVERGPLDTFRTPGRTAVVTYAEETNLTVGNAFVRELRAQGDTVTVFRLYPSSGPASYDSARTLVRQAGRAVFATSVRPIAWRGHVALPDVLAATVLRTATERPTALISLGSPYLLSQLPGFRGTFLIGWGAVSASERAAARGLTGAAAIAGTLPITLDAAHPRGSGLAIPARNSRFQP